MMTRWHGSSAGQHGMRLRRHRLLAPELLIAELLIAGRANILSKKVRRQEMLAQEATGLLTRSNIEFEPMAGLFEAATRLTISLDHPGYDCCYLVLSEFRGCDFVAADEALGRKIRSIASSGS